MPLRRLVDGWKPHVVFNLLNELQDIGAYEVHVASYLELLNVPYTGCNSRGLMLARDKPLSKKIFRYHRIPNPAFAVLRKGASARSVRKLAFPLFVKSADEDASMGVSQASIVWDPKELEERAAFVHRKLGTSAIVEEYIEGRELTIGLLGNDRLQTFPIWELFFENLPEGTEPIATARVKWNPTYRKRLGITTGPAKLKPELAARIAHMAKRVYRHLELSGFARLDLRLTKEGLVYFIEANPNPDLSDDEEFAAGARKAGIGYDALIQRILNLGIRYRPPWKVE
jgi:D-alanine-D-alanine ligase